MNTESTIRLFYWNDEGNFGDFLSPYLVSKITQRKITYCSSSATNKLVAIGSILSKETLFSSSHIWGSGALTPKFFRVPPFYNIKRTIAYRFKSAFYRSKIYALRGPLTAAKCESFGFDVPNVFGDPGILVSDYYQPNINADFEVGIVLHYAHKNIFSNARLPEKWKFIDIARKTPREIEKFIDELLSCKRIFSSSLHGIIVAQAYGVPAQWITFNNRPLNNKYNDFKFNDYFLGADQIVQQPICLDPNKCDWSTLIKTPLVHVDTHSLQRCKESLLSAFPEVSLISDVLP
ncbi:MAG TPA: polysaccharide pyruvyl transferase family protein [Candidatus Aphodousia faecavium]|nr:polysaccharide pyruvyl transferase family protein [Candidatus Aphodousia faecavium]